MKILVCGNSGFIGSHLTPALRAAGHEPVGLDLIEPADRRPLTAFYRGDIRCDCDVQAAMNGAQCVINLAAKHHDSGITRREYFDTNENGTKVLLDAQRRAGVRKHLFISSVAVYGNAAKIPNENTPPSPVSHYGKSKLAAEKGIEAWASEDSSAAATIIRPTVVFGEGNTANMFNLIRQIHRRRFFIVGDGTNIKSVCYVRNLVDAIVRCIADMPPGTRAINYVDKPDLPIAQTVSIISDSLGQPPPQPMIPLWLGVMGGCAFEIANRIGIIRSSISCNRIRKLAASTQFDSLRIDKLNFTPRFSIEDGLRNMVRWYLSEGQHIKKQPQASRRENPPAGDE